MQFRTKLFSAVYLCAAVGTLYACSSSEGTSTSTQHSNSNANPDPSATTDPTPDPTPTPTPTPPPDPTPTLRRATIDIRPWGDGGTSGTATLVEADGGVTFTVDVTHAPRGSRGIHVHLGKCENDGGPGGHFNPDPMALNGQLPNLQVDDAGVGHLVATQVGLTLDDAMDGGAGIVGRAVVVHGIQATYPDGGPVLDAGKPIPPPISGCGDINRSP